MSTKEKSGLKENEEEGIKKAEIRDAIIAFAGVMNLSIGLTINDTLLKQTKYYLIEDDKVSRIKGGV